MVFLLLGIKNAVGGREMLLQSLLVELIRVEEEKTLFTCVSNALSLNRNSTSEPLEITFQVPYLMFKGDIFYEGIPASN